MADGKRRKISSNELLDEYYAALHSAYDSLLRAFRFRSQFGLTQDDLANRLGVDKGLISKRLRGRENFTLKTLSAMASAMDCRLLISFVPYEEVGEDPFEFSGSNNIVRLEDWNDGFVGSDDATKPVRLAAA
jgi:ribosome-binding protein aMBF1 (putative translation factor)